MEGGNGGAEGGKEGGTETRPTAPNPRASGTEEVKEAIRGVLGSPAEDAVLRSQTLGIDWADVLALGHPQIDAQHRRLINLAGTLRAAADAGEALPQSVVEELISYARRHFSDEEALMLSFPYSEMEAHKRMHAAFVAEVRKAAAASSAASSSRLCAFVEDWLISHIAVVDRRMVARMSMGAEEAMLDADPITGQTHKVVKGALSQMGELKRLSDLLAKESGGTRSAVDFVKRIADVGERVSNLVFLAQSRIKAFGCTNLDAQGLRAMDLSMRAASEEVAKALAKDVLARTSRPSVGSGKWNRMAAVADRAARMEAIVRVCGGKVSAEADGWIAKARSAASRFAAGLPAKGGEGENSSEGGEGEDSSEGPQKRRSP